MADTSAKVTKPRPRWQGLSIELTEKQKLACALRIIARAGCNQDQAGHLTVVIDDAGNMLCNPWGKWWEEVRASDICTVSADGRVLEGPYDVAPAVFIHTEVHRGRPDASAAVHNHPYYGVLLGTMEVVPEIVEQQSSMFMDEILLLDEYGGAIDDETAGAALCRAIGPTASVIMLQNHGCLTLAPTVEIATYKAVTFERTCRTYYDALAAGVKPKVINSEAQAQMKPRLLTSSSQIFWQGAVRQLLAVEPDVLL